MTPLRAAAAAAILVLVAGCGQVAPTPGSASVALPQATTSSEPVTITLIRHASTDSTTLNSRPPGPSLSAAGREQARTAAASLTETPFDALVTSTLSRARETATEFGSVLGQQPQVLEGLEELHAGDYEGASAEEYRSQVAAAPERWLTGDLDARIPGGESGTEFLSRVDFALNGIAASGAQNALVVSHSGTIGYWVALRADGAGGTVPELQPTGFVVLSRTADGWRLVSSHPDALG